MIESSTPQAAREKRTPLERVKSSFSDDVFRRLFINAGKLLGASSLGSILALVTTTLAARHLGAAGFGTLALAVVYAETVGRLFNFQAWQAIVQYGSACLAKSDDFRLRQLLKLGYLLDAATAALGFVVALAAARPLIAWLGWDASMLPLVLLYSWLILFSLSGTATGVLRLFDRFDLLGAYSVLGAVIRLIGVGWCLLTGQGLLGFVWVYLVTDVAAHTYLLLASLWVLHGRGLGGWWRAPMGGLRDGLPGIWSFVVSTNLNMTVRLASTNLDMIIVGSLASLPVVGVYRLARTLGSVMNRLADPFYQAIYPELARLWNQGQRAALRSLVRRSTLMAGAGSAAVLAAFAVLGGPVIAYFYPASFLDLGLYSTTLLFLLGAGLGVTGLVLQPLALTLHLPTQVFWLNLALTTAYLLVLAPAVRFGQAPGAAAAAVFLGIAGAVGRYLLIRRKWRQTAAQ